MNKPTQEQIKEFWEWCGLKLMRAPDGNYHWFQLSADGNYDIVSPVDSETDLPCVDLNNLFKYAIPLAIKKAETNQPRRLGLLFLWWLDKIREGYSFEDALFWAIWEGKAYCNKCNHTGLLPLLNKQGAIVPFAWAYCDCHPIYGLNPEPEHYSRLKPEHFDFPCSDSFRGYTFEEYTGRDPAYPYSEYPKRVLSYPEEVTPDKTYIVEHIRSYVPPLKLTERIKQLEADIDGLKKGYHTHPDKKGTERYIIK